MEIVSVNSSSVTLQWRPPDILNGTIIQYSLQYNTTPVENVTGDVFMYTVGGLSAETIYSLQVRAHTGAGAGPPSIITATTRKLLAKYHHTLAIIILLGLSIACHTV